MFWSLVAARSAILDSYTVMFVRWPARERLSRVARRLSCGHVDAIVIKFKFIFGAESRTVLEGYDRGSLLLFYGFEEARVVRLAGVI